MDLENILLIAIILGIGILLGMSMLTPNLPTRSNFWKPAGKASSSFPLGFFIWMLLPTLAFILLGIVCFIFCSESYSLENILPLLSAFWVLWISVVAIKYISPLFIGDLNFDSTSYHSVLWTKTPEIKKKNLTKYITYIFLFAILLFLLFFVNTKILSEGVADFFKDFWYEWKVLDDPYFAKCISWLFYIFVCSALMGILTTLKMFARELERRGNEQLQTKKLYDFISKNFKA